MPTAITIKTFTKIDFFSWVINGEQNGLDDSIISRNRAIAQMNNPDAEIEDILLSTAVIDGFCIGYRGVVPEKIIQKKKHIKIGWLTTFFVDPAHRGKGIAKSLMEPIEKYYTKGIGSIHSSENALKVYAKLGWNISYLGKTTFLFRLYIPKNYTLKKRVLSIFRPGLNYLFDLFHHRWLMKSYLQKYEVEYVELINKELNLFIQNNVKSDIFPKSQERLNWILKYKWAALSPCLPRVNKNFYFTNYLKDFFQYAVSVKTESSIIGFYILRKKNGHLTIPFLYYDNDKKEYVFRSILEHVIELKGYSITTSNDDLVQFINESKLIWLAKQKLKISYSHTNQEYFKMRTLKLQDGDGDLFF